MRIARPALILIAISLVVHGQNGTASLTGKVQDLTGAGIPNALAQLRSEKHGTAFSARTDDSGTFRVSGLPVDDYTLRIERPGFRSFTVRSIHISGGEQQSIPSLELFVAGCSDGPGLEYLRFLPTKHAGNLRATVRLDQGPMVGKSPPIAGADVTLICGRRICAETKTDAQGEFLFAAFPPGMYGIHVKRRGFYPLEESDYQIQQGRELAYWPLYLERCYSPDCDPARRPRKPPAVCE